MKHDKAGYSIAGIKGCAVDTHRYFLVYGPDFLSGIGKYQNTLAGGYGFVSVLTGDDSGDGYVGGREGLVYEEGHPFLRKEKAGMMQKMARSGAHTDAGTFQRG